MADPQVLDLAAYLQQCNLAPLHNVAALAGVLLSVWLIKLSTHDLIGKEDRWCFRWAARFSYAAIGIAMAWSSYFGFQQGWQPWPPHLALCIALDVKMVGSVLAAYFRRPVSA